LLNQNNFVRLTPLIFIKQVFAFAKFLFIGYNIGMNEITQITPQKKGDRLNVHIDGRFAFGVHYETAVKFGLKAGRELSPADIEQIEEEEGNVFAFNRALKYAVKKTVSVKQMSDYLVRNGYSLAATQRAIDKLKEYGYVGDESFAKAYVATYGEARGARRIELELKKAGVPEQIIADALCELDESSACAKCIDKYVRTHKDVDKKKLISYLLYRGFEYDEINESIGRSELWK